MASPVQLNFNPITTLKTFFPQPQFPGRIFDLVRVLATEMMRRKSESNEPNELIQRNHAIAEFNNLSLKIDIKVINNEN